MAASNSLRWLQNKNKKFCALQNENDFAHLLETDLYKLILYAKTQPYRVFEIDKPNGKKRIIEDPDDALKEILRNLNNYLQCVYYFMKPHSAYGFILNIKKETAPRNMLTNAEKHLHCKYLLNTDMQDFFHLTTREKVVQIFMHKPFHFAESLSHLIADLCTHNHRLPMGSPASPVISNFSAYALDLELQQYALQHTFTYTRFVDDMSFSHHKTEIKPTHLDQINEIVQSHDFVLNPNKIKWYGPKDEKLITGLCLKNKRAEIPQKFFDQLQKDLIRLKGIYEVYFGLQKSGGADWVDTFTENIQGRINFVQYVYGNKSPEYKKLEKQFEQNTKPADDIEILHWLELPYGF